MGLLVTNGGILGAPLALPWISDSTGCHLGSLRLEPPLAADEYPLGSRDKTLGLGALWVGGIAEDGDTLVSVGYAGLEPNFEFYPDPAPYGEITLHSISNPKDVRHSRS